MPKQKYQAATRQISRPMAEDYDHEPNMKLSNAFFVVLILHVVAVGGIITFSRIKADHSPPAEALYTAAPAASASEQQPEVPADPAPAPAVKAPEIRKTSDAEKTYTVAKGDNPVAIARRLHVSYDALLKLNKIDDPKKLQIGQKLRVPAKNKPARADD